MASVALIDRGRTAAEEMCSNPVSNRLTTGGTSLSCGLKNRQTMAPIRNPSSAGTNAAGGRIFTATGTINQNDFAGIVNAGVIQGEPVTILTGVHGFADGSVIADPSLYADDVLQFGDLPSVSVRDVSSMSPAEIRQVLDGPGVIIGGFCESGACLVRLAK
jgi:hypothetical protein